MDYQKLFITGCPRSGTGWVLSIFQNHPSVISLSESHAYPIVFEPFLKYGWKKIFKNYILPLFLNKGIRWKRVLNNYDKYHNKEYNLKEYYSVGLRNCIDRNKFCKIIEETKTKKKLSDIEKAEFIINYAFDSFFIKSKGTMDNLFVEKTPSHLLYADKILNKYPNSKLIEIIRDGRDVCVSLEMLRRKWCPKMRKNQIKLWLKYINFGIKLQSNRKFSKRILQARYEKLKKNPAKEIKKMFEFADLDNSSRLIKRIISLTDFKNHKNTGDGKHDRKGIVEDWKNHFNFKDIELFKKMANNTLIKLGYNW